MEAQPNKMWHYNIFALKIEIYISYKALLQQIAHFITSLNIFWLIYLLIYTCLGSSFIKAAKWYLNMDSLAHISKFKSVFLVLVFTYLISDSNSSVLEVDEDDISTTNYGYSIRVFILFFRQFPHFNQLHLVFSFRVQD